MEWVLTVQVLLRLKHCNLRVSKPEHLSFPFYNNPFQNLYIQIRPKSQVKSSNSKMEESFQSWFLHSGGTLHPSVEIASDSTGSFLRTRNGQNLPPGSCVVSCPHTLTLSWLNVIHSSESFLNDFDLRTASHMINETVLTRFFLMKQYVLKEKSFWWSYIQSLPQPDLEKHLNLPFWYDAEDLIWIRGTNLEYAMREKEQIWRREFEEGARLLALEGIDGNQNWSWFVFLDGVWGSSNY